MLRRATLAALLTLPAAGTAAKPLSLTSLEVNLSLDRQGRLRVIERTHGHSGPFERELATKRLGFDGLRRVYRLKILEVLCARGTPPALTPVPWTTVPTRRGLRLKITAPAASGWESTLVIEGEPLVVDGLRTRSLIWPLPGPNEGFGPADVTLDRSSQTVHVSAGANPFASVDLPAETPLPARGRRRLLLDNLHVAVGFGGLASLLLMYLFLPVWPSRDGRPWSLAAAGGAFSAGTVAAMRLAESPADIGAWSAVVALAAGALAALAGAAVLGLWGLTAVLTRSALRPGAPRPIRLWLTAAAAGFASFGATTAAADVFTRCVRDLAPLALAAGAGHLVLHAAAFRLRRPADKP